ncbi:MFS transporter [Photobacterium galatheae]|uniref:MFS transporter permease n=1 Tax=Photobacterium galatheae TaxID=1654360 RepID=A0A066RWN3_9GAMM|nr:MFS transporter [Photobacterium galatheae]KDM91793.1 MFS transporter permease [Photobacterium galatheae]MCM0147113.1 MFS transporter [Photobacterium galatheae]
MIEIHSAAYRRASFALALGSFLVFCNLYLFQPMLPVMTEAFSASATRVNWLLAAGTLALALTLVPWAVSSEMVGRRRVMLLSLFLLPLVGGIMLFANSLLMLSLARALMGASLAGFAAVAVAYMAEEFSPKALSLAVGGYISANSLGGIAGRLFGGFASDAWGWQGAVAGMAVLSLIGAIVVTRLLPPQQYFTPQRGQLRHHTKHVIRHLQQPALWIPMLIGGINFALFVNLYTVMGFRLVSPPYNLPVSWASMIFLCYLSGTLTAKLSGRWSIRYKPLNGMVLGTTISVLGMWVAALDSLSAMLVGLLLISSGAFFTHSLAYAWVSQKAKSAKATATALYLVHYYIGGSLGGFYLITCWQYWGWHGVLAGGSGLYLLLYGLCWKLGNLTPVPETAVSNVSS